jgi:hypothetical protein
MNQRLEPRFKTDTGVTLQLAKQTQRIPARLVDVSGLGFRVLVEQPIAVGEVLQINAEDHRLLVTARHCSPTEHGYFVGVERIDKWLPGETRPRTEVLGRPQIKTDIDPLRLMGMRNQFSKQSAGPETGPGRRNIALLGIAAAIGLSVLALIGGGVRGWGHGTVPAPPVGTKADKTEPTAVPVKKAFAKKPAPAAATNSAVPSGAVQVTLHASELSWVDACADGRVVFSKAFNAGETGQIKFVNVATVRSGNAGGLEIAFASNPAERMGEKGLIHMWKFTPAGHQEVTPGSPSACTTY